MCIVVLHGAQWGLLGAVLVVQSDSSRKEGPVLPLLHTLRVNQSVPEGAAQCWDSDLQEVGLLHQQWLQLIHHLHWVKRASQDGAGLLHKFLSYSLTLKATPSQAFPREHHELCTSTIKYFPGINTGQTLRANTHQSAKQHINIHLQNSNLWSSSQSHSPGC